MQEPLLEQTDESERVAELQKRLKHEGLKEELHRRNLKATGRTAELASRLALALAAEAEDAVVTSRSEFTKTESAVELQERLRHQGLKEELQRRNLKATGKTNELATRLEAAIALERQEKHRPHSSAKGWRRSISTFLHSRPVEIVVILMVTSEIVMTSTEIGVSENIVCIFGKSGPKPEHGQGVHVGNQSSHYRRLRHVERNPMPTSVSTLAPSPKSAPMLTAKPTSARTPLPSPVPTPTPTTDVFADGAQNYTVPPGYVLCEGPDGPHVEPVIRSFAFWAKLFAMLFALEVLLKIGAGGAEFFSESWHIVDFVVVVVNAAVEFVIHDYLHSSGLEAEELSQVLLLVRLWRLIKFFNLVREEKELVQSEA